MLPPLPHFKTIPPFVSCWFIFNGKYTLIFQLNQIIPSLLVASSCITFLPAFPVWCVYNILQALKHDSISLLLFIDSTDFLKKLFWVWVEGWSRGFDIISCVHNLKKKDICGFNRENWREFISAGVKSSLSYHYPEHFTHNQTLPKYLIKSSPFP